MSTQSLTSPNLSSSVGTDASRDRLLRCGIAAGPVFIAVVALQVAFRDGFDLSRQPLSLLSLGDFGWIQIANFIVAGVLSIACAIGLRRALTTGPGRTWAPRLIGIYGVGLIVAGIFVADPSMGFPAGAPAGNPEQLSWHAVLHGVGMMLSFPPLTVACFVFVRRFIVVRQRVWAAYSAAIGLAAPVLVAWPGQSGLSVRLAVAAVLTFTWLSAIAAHHVGRG